MTTACMLFRGSQQVRLAVNASCFGHTIIIARPRLRKAHLAVTTSRLLLHLS
jgi:hypothetical protein